MCIRALFSCLRLKGMSVLCVRCTQYTHSFHSSLSHARPQCWSSFNWTCHIMYVRHIAHTLTHKRASSWVIIGFQWISNVANMRSEHISLLHMHAPRVCTTPVNIESPVGLLILIFLWNYWVVKCSSPWLLWASYVRLLRPVEDARGDWKGATWRTGYVNKAEKL